MFKPISIYHPYTLNSWSVFYPIARKLRKAEVGDIFEREKGIQKVIQVKYTGSNTNIEMNQVIHRKMEII